VGIQTWKKQKKEEKAEGFQDFLALKIILCYYLSSLQILVFFALGADFSERNLALCA